MATSEQKSVTKEDVLKHLTSLRDETMKHLGKPGHNPGVFLNQKAASLLGDENAKWHDLVAAVKTASSDLLTKLMALKAETPKFFEPETQGKTGKSPKNSQGLEDGPRGNSEGVGQASA